jgi:hypothetical protein
MERGTLKIPSAWKPFEKDERWLLEPALVLQMHQPHRGHQQYNPATCLQRGIRPQLIIFDLLARAMKRKSLDECGRTRPGLLEGAV